MIVAAILAAAVAVGWARLVLRHRRVPMATWRLATLMVAQPLVAALLHVALLPPVRSTSTDTLIVATANAPRWTAGRGGTVVALPEAGRMAGVPRAPDLATALRRHPGTAMVRVIGDGIVPRDRTAATGVSLRFDAPPAPTGLVALDPPVPAAPGGLVTLAARVAGVKGASVELVDPAGRIVDAGMPAADGRIALSATGRAHGSALFSLRLRRGGAIIDQTPVPVVVEAPPPTRVVVVADAPGAEVKYLRRWAVDAGLSASTSLGIGRGAALADGGGSFEGADVAILDDRAWAAMPASRRAAIGVAVRAGLGLVIRITGPVPRRWSLLGLDIDGSAATAPVTLLPSAPSDAMLAARRGPGTQDNPAAIAGPYDTLPVLTRQVIGFGTDAVPILRDARGVAVAAWRPVGKGRVAVVSLHDTFALSTSAHPDRYGETWSAIVSAVARPRATAHATIDPLPQAGRRLTICDARGATVVAPGGGATALLDDGAACAGYWPASPGWHRVTGVAARAFYVYSPEALPALRRTQIREATLRLVGDRSSSDQPGHAGAALRGSRWPWSAAWLLAAAGLWWFERTRRRARQ